MAPEQLIQCTVPPQEVFLSDDAMKSEVAALGRTLKKWPYFRMNTFSDVSACVWSLYTSRNRREFNQQVDDVHTEGEAIAAKVIDLAIRIGPSLDRHFVRKGIRGWTLEIYRVLAAFDHHADMARFGILKYYVRTPILGFQGGKGGRKERRSVPPCIVDDLPPSSEIESDIE